MKMAVRNQKGFTLIELLIVLAIIAALVAVFLVATQGSSDKKNASLIQRQAQQLVSALTLYKADMGGYPPRGTSSSVASLQPLWDRNVISQNNQPFWRGPYFTPDMVEGTSPNQNVSDQRIAGVIYSYVKLTTSGGSGSCNNAANVGTNNTNGTDHTIKISGVPLDVAKRIKENLGLKVCVSSNTDDPTDVYVVIEETW